MVEAQSPLLHVHVEDMSMIIHMFRLLGLGARKVSGITSWSRAITSNGMRPVCMMLDVKRGLELFHERLPKASSVSKYKFPSSWSARNALLAYLRQLVDGCIPSQCRVSPWRAKSHPRQQLTPVRGTEAWHGP